jgi:hypothetical protein
VNYQNFSPAVSPTFNNNCVAGATVLTGSCTEGFGYWSSTTFTDFPGLAWFVNFFDGFVPTFDKLNELSVRAVRGGL